MTALARSTHPSSLGAEACWRDDLSRARQLVQAPWLGAMLSGAQVDDAPSGEWRLYEVGEGPWHAQRTPTIPGASWLNVQHFEEGSFWNKVADGVLLQRLAAMGVAHDTTVVLAGRNLVANARMAHLMLYAGVQDVRLLDGGTLAWAQAGGALTQTAPPQAEHLPSFGLARPACPRYLVDTAQVQALRRRPEATLVSIRTWGEFVGRTSGYDYIPARGEIAGARWGHAGADGDVNDMSAFHTPAGLMRSAAEIEALWRSQGILPQGPVVFYCGTGWRASLAFFYAWLMGWDDISVYDGGWMEWSSDAVNPVVNRHGSGVAAPDPSAPVPVLG